MSYFTKSIIVILNFNSSLKPAEVFVIDGKPILIRKRDVFEDLLKNQVI